MATYNKLNNVNEDYHNPTKSRQSSSVNNVNRAPLRPRHMNIDSTKDVENGIKIRSGKIDNLGRGTDGKRLQISQRATAHRSSSVSSRNSSNSRTKSSSNSLTEEHVIIEEHRKNIKGEGHTIHQYVRGKLLGKGGFAKVYLCKSMDTKRSYAIKIVPKANLVKSRARQKLQTEIKIHRTLKHQNICEYKHFFEDKTNCYILLELCQNQSMNELIKRRKRLTEPEVKYYMSQLIDAVRYMHDNNVIHRDLKLGNLFIDKYLQIKVGDLGLASKLSSSEEKRKTICGTPNYIAPEVIDGNKEKRGHSFEVDIWSMGVICFTTLVGKPPYESKDVKSTYQRILANKYSFPAHIPISEEARDLISRMLQTRPDMRPSLNEIRGHSFFTIGGKIPHTLPQSSMHIAPDWEEDEFGNLICAVETRNSRRSRFGESTSRRTDFSSRRKLPDEEQASKNTDTVHHRHPTTSRNDNKAINNSKDINHNEDVSEKDLVKDHLTQKPARITNSGKYDSDTDDCERERASGTIDTNFPEESAPFSAREELAQQSNPLNPLRSKSQLQSEEQFTNIEKRMQQCTIRKDTTSADFKCHLAENLCTNKHNSESEPKMKENEGFCGKTNDYDMKALEEMHTRLNDMFLNVENFRGTFIHKPCQPIQVCGPTKWVTRYVDYTSKYGLGFLLNDGSAGVYFNDSTKTVIAPKGEDFVYVERRKSQNEEGVQEQVVEEHTLSKYPDTLQKKVTLLKHFRNYLIEQQKREISQEEQFDPEDCDDDGSMVYLKKWVRTKHAILFRLSNRTVQVIFYDHSEILLLSDGKSVSYVDKRKQRNTYNLNDIIMGTAHADIKKRLKYTKDILNQLTSSKM